MSDIEFGWPIAFPFACFAVAWFSFRHRRPLAKVWASAAATLLSLPVGSGLITRIELPASWYPNYGDHSPGVGVAFAPLVVGWVLCTMVWTGAMGVMVAKYYRPKNSK